MNQLTNLKINQVLGYFAAGTTAKKGDLIDMAGYEGCLFIFELGTLVENGTLVASVTANSTSTTGGTALAATASHTVTAVTAALTQSALAIDVYQPEPVDYRYLEPIITPAVQNAVILGITAIRYGGKLKAEDVDDLLASTLATSPAAA